MAKSGLPKMYAKMGFKKGWAAYKRARGSKSGKKKAAKKAPTRPMHHAKKKHPKKHSHSAGAVVVHHSSHRGGSSVKVSKHRLQEFKDKLKRASARLRGSKDMGLMDAGLAMGEGIAGGLISTYAIGMIPVPASLPKPGLIKSGLQMALGITGAVMLKNKHLRYMSMGAATLGGVGVIREFVTLPTFAGEVDEAMYGESGAMQDNYAYSRDSRTMGEPLGEPLGAETGTFNPFG